MNYWALPPYKINFTGTSPTASLLPNYNSAQFYGLTGLAFDNTGNLIVAGYQDNSIRKVSPGGVVTTLAGNGYAGHYDAVGSNAMFFLPASVVLDASQNIYVADMGNNCIRKITPAGVVSTFAGSTTTVSGHIDAKGTAARFNQPYGITIDASGNLFVADRENHCIRKITSAGDVTTVAGSITNVSGFADLTGTSARFNKPINITIDAAGNFYITDNGNNRIRKMTPGGVVTTIAGNGTAGFINATGTAALFNQPFGIAVDAYSNLYVSEIANSVIRKITSAGDVTTYAGSGVAGFADGPVATAKFQWPTGLTLDASGNLFVAGNETHRVRKITPAGIVSTYAGSGVAGFADTPLANYKASNGAFDENGNILFSIENNNIYNSLGTSIGTLADYLEAGTNNYGDLGNEVSIVPVPGSCRDFYIIYLKYGFSDWFEGVKLLYTKVSVSATGVVTIVNNGVLIGSAGGDFMCFAVSKLNNTNNTRFVYGLGTNALTRYTISSSGIGSGTPIPGITSNFSKILELSSDGDKLAWIERSGGNIASVHIYNIPTATDVKKNITITGASYSGLEFSADGSSIYFSVESGTASGGIYKVSTSGGTGSVTPTQIISGHYTNTELELARDGFIYAIDGLPAYSYTLTNGTLGKINTSTDIITPLNILIPSAERVYLLYGGFYMLPDQIDGENYDYFFGTAKLTNIAAINGSAISPTIPLNTYTCGAISLSNTASVATSYQITVTKTDASGNVLTGPQAYSYSTGTIVAVPPANIDIKALNANYLATNTGYYKITFLTQNACESNTVNGLIQNSSLSAATADFRLNDGGGNAFIPNNTLPGSNVSAYGAAVSGSYSTGYVSSYQIKVDQIDCSTGTVLTANVVNTPSINVTNGDPTTITAVNLNSKSGGYFISHAGCFKITYTVNNLCGSSTQTGYFNEDVANWRIGNVDSKNSNDMIYPNPANGITTLAFTLKEDNTVSFILNNIQGGSSYTIFSNQPLSQGNNEMVFDTNLIPAGIYVYQLSDGTNTFQTGKFVVVK